MTQPLNIKTRDDSNIMNNPASYGSLDNMRGGRRSMSDTSAFRNLAITDLQIPASVTKLDNYLFYS